MAQNGAFLGGKKIRSKKPFRPENSSRTSKKITSKKNKMEANLKVPPKTSNKKHPLLNKSTFLQKIPKLLKLKIHKRGPKTPPKCSLNQESSKNDCPQSP